MTTPLLYGFPETQAALGGIGRTHVYELVSAGDLKLVKIGRRSFITSASLTEFVERLASTPEMQAGEASQS